MTGPRTDGPTPDRRGGPTRKPASPRVSIVMPTYNRAVFLPVVLGAIGEQTFADWELIVVDDGGADGSADLVNAFAEARDQPVTLLRQENAGAGAARRHGLRHVRGEFVAFCDSDDPWLPHHLTDCLAAFDHAPELDWVFAAARTQEWPGGRVVTENTIAAGLGNRASLKLTTRAAGPVRVINDPSAKRCAIQHGAFGGMQASVLRRRVFEAVEFPPDRVGEDHAFGTAVILNDFRVGYLNDVHIVRQVHADHVSGVAAGQSLEKAERVNRAFVEAWERLDGLICLSPAERRLLRRRLAALRFWQLGYAVFAQAGEYRQALREYRVALQWSFWNPRMWKTYAATRLKQALSSRRKSEPSR